MRTRSDVCIELNVVDIAVEGRDLNIHVGRDQGTAHVVVRRDWREKRDSKTDLTVDTLLEDGLCRSVLERCLIHVCNIARGEVGRCSHPDIGNTIDTN